jgi:predicted metal-dependent enzyme (double-stranded beta helix superfamily)
VEDDPRVIVGKRRFRCASGASTVTAGGDSMSPDDLVAECAAALATTEPLPATRVVLERASRDPKLRDALRHGKTGINVLYNAAGLTVLNVVWPPAITLVPHNHLMWAAIAIYDGREENRFFRRNGTTIAPSGGKELDEGDVLLLGDDAIHSVHNPMRAYTGAIHVYGGDFVKQPRSQWTGEKLEEAPYDYDAIREQFAQAEREAGIAR